ncbi:MAG: carboxypeptidase-like regulatory domain-containing protein [Muribaculaceae bacterium]|nr:carboxypeptidase-like regulatory domain-containing protein [Muribaculaceae bacterium]
MKRIFVITSFMILICAQTICAQIKLYGSVSDSSGEPLEAMITVMDAGRLVAHTMADETGEYELEFLTKSDSITVKASMLGYNALKKDIVASSSRVDFTLQSGNVLKDVVVVADKIKERGDTISYNVAAFKSESDRVIGDVIKKMPGLEVSESGRITFNGKTVKNFYVENMDLLEGRYGIATNNISANDVASVQVYQNHQPIRALQDRVPTDDVTLNLTLKSSARGTFSLNGMVGAGYKPMMWAAEAVAMYFGKKAQTITTYKGNNSGDNITAEQKSLTGDESIQFLNKAPLSVVSPGVPGVASKRYMNNRSNTITTNNILKIDSITTVNLSLGYIADILQNIGESTTEQYLPTGDYRWISQKISVKNYVHTLRASNTFKKNAPNLYIANTLNVNAGWNKDKGEALTSSSFMTGSESVGQILRNPSFMIDDRISLISNSGSRSWQLDFAVGWNHRPQTLTVAPASIFGQEDTEDVKQDYTTDDFRVKASTGAGYRFEKFYLNLLAFGNVDIESVASLMEGLSFEAPALTDNKYTFGKGQVGIEPRISYYVNNDFYVELMLPISYDLQWLNDKLDTTRDRTWSYLNIMPSYRLTYSLGKSWWELNSSFYQMRDNSGRAASGIVMTDYLSFRQYLIEKTLSDKIWYSTFGYHYKNAIAQLFGNASGSWWRSWHNTMTGYEYDGLATIRTVYELPYVSDRFTLSANINKGLGFWESTVKLNGNYSLNVSQQIINREPVDYKAQYWSTNLMFATTPARWMGAALGLAYGESKSFTEINKTKAPAVRQYTGRLDLNFFPVQRMVANFAAENNYTNMTDEGRNSLFCDVKLTYKFMRCDVELEFNNIFNRKQFSRVSYDGMNIYRSIYDLRPRNVMVKVRFNVL